MNGIHLLLFLVIGICLWQIPKRDKKYKDSKFSNKYNIKINKKVIPKDFQQYNNILGG